MDTLKFQDSIILFQNGVIRKQHDSLAFKGTLVDSLNNVIKKGGQQAVEMGNYDWCEEKFFHILHQVRILMFTEESIVLLFSCSFLGLVIVSLDWLSFWAAGNDTTKLSFLSLKYSGKRAIILNYLLWGIGAGLIAYLTSAMGIFKSNFASCAIISVSWPTIFPKLVKKLNKSAEDEVEQTIT
ncbi:MAG: hypothetical protein ACT4ON_11065 [Bacteroidota bacterium]